MRLVGGPVGFEFGFRFLDVSVDGLALDFSDSAPLHKERFLVSRGPRHCNSLPDSREPLTAQPKEADFAKEIQFVACLARAEQALEFEKVAPVMIVVPYKLTDFGAQVAATDPSLFGVEKESLL